MNPTVVSCPHCGQAVDPMARLCEHCGVDLALAAILAERDLETSISIDDGILISPEILVPRLGQYLIEKGLLDSKMLDEALEHQAKHATSENPPLIGQTLLEMGLVSKEDLDQAITEQIIELQSALKSANIDLENRIRERTLELERAYSRLSEINQLKSNFIANVSHELRTPLTHIKGYLDLMIEGELGSLSDEQMKALKVMEKSEERLERLIEDLIHFSLAARGDLDLEIRPIPLRKKLPAIISEAREKCQKNNLVFHMALPDDLPDVAGDWSKISWVIRQLIDNAVKFTPENGCVSLEVIISDPQLIIAVSDTGIGISQYQIDEIFEPFHQLDGSATRRYGGTGLGLTLAKRIVEGHDSDIKVHSQLNRGTRFEFALPKIC